MLHIIQTCAFSEKNEKDFSPFLCMNPNSTAPLVFSHCKHILPFYFLCSTIPFSWPFILSWFLPLLLYFFATPHLHLCSTTVPYGIPAQVWQVGQLLHLDDAIIEAGLQTLGHHVGKNDSHHHGEDVRDLTCQLEADHSSGDSVAHRSCQSCCTFPR